MSHSFADHFSSGASEYARYRPSYPSALFAWLASITRLSHCAWDCATGSGQAAIALAEHFDEVIATDASEAQLQAATPNPRVHYVCATAERSALRDASADLVTVAQALHWLNASNFYDEVTRVVVPGGIVAVWSYGPIQVDRDVDDIIDELYRCTLGCYWPSDRKHVDSGYRDLPFPFAAFPAPDFAMSAQWTLAEVLGYIGTWSATKRYERAQGSHAIEQFATRLAARWGDPSDRREARWPLAVRVGRVGAPSRREASGA